MNRYGLGSAVGDWVNMDVTKNGNSYYASVDFEISNFDRDKSYSFETRAIDKLETASSTLSGVKSIPIFHWSEDDFVFEVPVTFNAGTEGFSTSYGEWIPSLSSSAIASYITREGWYSKVGRTVTVGFYIKATCNSGYDDVAVSITGLPFLPLCSAAGGGMCSLAHIIGDYNFQCFVVETDGTITTRVQACNNTSACNLYTTASGCNYPYNGGLITLSGTITYITNS